MIGKAVANSTGSPRHSSRRSIPKLDLNSERLLSTDVKSRLPFSPCSVRNRAKYGSPNRPRAGTATSLPLTPASDIASAGHGEGQDRTLRLPDDNAVPHKPSKYGHCSTPSSATTTSLTTGESTLCTNSTWTQDDGNPSYQRVRSYEHLKNHPSVAKSTPGLLGLMSRNNAKLDMFAEVTTIVQASPPSPLRMGNMTFGSTFSTVVSTSLSNEISPHIGLGPAPRPHRPRRATSSTIHQNGSLPSCSSVLAPSSSGCTATSRAELSRRKNVPSFSSNSLASSHIPSPSPSAHSPFDTFLVGNKQDGEEKETMEEIQLNAVPSKSKPTSPILRSRRSQSMENLKSPTSERSPRPASAIISLLSSDADFETPLCTGRTTTTTTTFYTHQQQSRSQLQQMKAEWQKLHQRQERGLSISSAGTFGEGSALGRTGVEHLIIPRTTPIRPCSSTAASTTAPKIEVAVHIVYLDDPDPEVVTEFGSGMDRSVSPLMMPSPMCNLSTSSEYGEQQQQEEGEEILMPPVKTHGVLQLQQPPFRLRRVDG
ncbi:hypothetical protein A4X09_0g266 [Tilletia walkeri]|uniref:Uncharacterized protein n=1 Tax=Tilletia walkeri TaxID=117179 RepID=A0A8X7NHQ4_9BASI|nr:hypothetical protein A4X09_0g266 [Tilletia walkeri]